MMSNPMPIQGLAIDPENGLVQSLYTEKGVFPVTTAGCEIGNWLGFFSQQKMSGVDCSIVNRKVDISESQVTSQFEIKFPRAHFSLWCNDYLQEGVWCRRYIAKAIEPSWLGDFVVRLGVPSSYWPSAGSEVHCSRYRGWNTYHQYPVRSVSLNTQQCCIETEITSVGDHGGRLGTVSYWRDEPGENWIVHHRLLVRANDLDHVVGRFRRLTVNSVDTPWIKHPFIWKPIWAFNERWASRLPINLLPTFQSQGVILLATNEEVSLETKLKLSA